MVLPLSCGSGGLRAVVLGGFFVIVEGTAAYEHGHPFWRMGWMKSVSDENLYVRSNRSRSGEAK
jgi:hypothetical protein